MTENLRPEVRSVNELLSNDRYVHQAYVFSSFLETEPDAEETEGTQGKIGRIDFVKSPNWHS